MQEIKIGNKKYKLQYGYAVVAKGDVMKHAMSLQDVLDNSNSEDAENPDFFEQMGEMMNALAEMLLGALQKFHSDEFGYQVRSGNGKDAALEKVYDLLDKYFDSEDSDVMGLYEVLLDELEKNGFLHHILREVEKQTETEK